MNDIRQKPDSENEFNIQNSTFKIRQGLVSVMGLLLAMLVCILIGILMSCCSPKTIPYPVETVRTEHIEADTTKFMALINSLRDEIKSRERTTDSVVKEHRRDVTVNEHGDTTKEKETVYIYISNKQEREFRRIIESQHDSISQLTEQLASVKSDSIPVPYPVERELTRWEKTKMDFGGVAIGGAATLCVVAIALAVWLIKIKRKK